MSKLRQQAPFDAEIPVSGAQLASVLGLHRSRVSRLRDAGVLREDDAGRYFLGEAVRSYIGFLKDTAPASSGVAAARAALLDEQRRRLRLLNDAKEGRLVDIEALQIGINAMTTALVNTLEGIPARVAGAVAGMTGEPALIKATVQVEIRRARQEMTDSLNALCGEDPK